MNRNRLAQIIQRALAGSVCAYTVLSAGAASADSAWDNLMRSHFMNTIADVVETSVDYMQSGLEESKTSQKITVKNAHSQKRKFYWTAAGCAGLTDGVAIVCHSEEVAANWQADYTFKTGTSQRNLRARHLVSGDSCDGQFDVNSGRRAQGEGTISFRCSTAEYLAGKVPPVAAKPPATYSINVSSKRKGPVVVVAGAPGCSGAYAGLSKVCASITVPANGSARLVYPSSAPEGGIVTWFEGTQHVGTTIPHKRESSMTIPVTGNQASLQ